MILEASFNNAGLRVGNHFYFFNPLIHNIPKWPDTLKKVLSQILQDF